MGAARLVTSPMLRARQTADPIARELGLEPHVCSAIHELREAGDYANLPPEEQKLRRWSVRMQESAHDPDQAPEGAESFNGVLARVRQFKAELESWRVEGPVIAVSHGIYSRFFLFDSLLGDRFEAQQVERLWQLRTANCGISVFERDERHHPTDPQTREWVCATWMARPWAPKLVASSS